MIDLRLIREQPDVVRQGMARLHADAPIDQILELDAQRRDQLSRVEELKATRNTGSKEIRTLKPGPERDAKIAAMRSLGDLIQEIDAEVTQTEEQLNDLLLEVPNLPDPGVPDG